MKKYFRKALASVVAFAICLGMISVGAFAASEKDIQAEKQIVTDPSTIYYDAQGNAVAGATGLGDNIVTSLSKNVIATGTENVFDILLEVKTNVPSVQTTTVAPNSAVSLVVDVSATMAFRDLDDSSNVNEQINNSRLNLAKAAMRDFLVEYAKTGRDANGNQIANRWVSLVGFGGQAWNYLYGYGSWLDVADPAQLDILINENTGILRHWQPTTSQANNYSGNLLGSGNKYIDRAGIIAGETYNFTSGWGNGGTNIEGGLMLANNIWQAGGKVANVDKAHSWTIMLSDGQPTVFVPNTTNYSSYINRNYDYSSTSIIFGDGSSNYDNNAVHSRDFREVGIQANAIKNRSTLEVVAIGSDGWLNKTHHADMGKCEDWLKGLSTNNSIHKAGATGGSIATDFTDIYNSIRGGISVTTTESWAVTDPMNAENSTDYISFLGFYNNNGVYEAGLKSLTGTWTAGGGDTASYVDGNGNINWNLKASGYVLEDNVYTYSLKYRVRLANEMADFVEGKSIDTNGRTTLSFRMKTDGIFGDTRVVDFPIPAVKGYLSSLSFNKVDDAGNPVPGAVFTLTHNCGNCGVTINAMTATADDNGTVTFSKVPSGHSYTLTETSAPTGYVANTASSGVVVSYDEITVSGNLIQTDKDTWYVENQRELVDLTIVKEWQATSGEGIVTTYDVYKTVTGAAAEKELVTTVTITGAGSKTVEDLAKYEAGALINYTVEERDGDGYKQLSAVKDGNTFTFTNILSDDTSFTISKEWIAPEEFKTEVTVNLYRVSANEAEGLVNSYALNEANGWSVTVDMPVYDEQGAVYTYSIQEVGAENGSITIGGHVYDVTVDGMTVTNTIADTTSVTFDKVWVAPEEFKTAVTINLYRVSDNEQKALVGSYVLDETNSWTKTVDELAAYDAQGAAYTYTVEEDGAENGSITIGGHVYDVTVDGMTVTNTIADTTSVTFNKVWVAPEEFKTAVTINLYRVSDNEQKTLVDSYVLDESNSWTKTVDELAVYDAQGAAYTYTIEENGAENGSITFGDHVYDVVVDGMTVTNTIADNSSVTINKVWVDAEGLETAVTINLYRTSANEEKTLVGSYVLDESNGWTKTVEGLDSYDAQGAAYTYSIEEVGAENGSIILGENEFSVEIDGMTVTNTLVGTDIPDEEPPLSDIPVTGDNSGIWYVLALISGICLIGVVLFSRRKLENE